VSNEDEDDHRGDRCSADRNHDGVDDEDEGDLLGSVASFEPATGQLVLTTVAGLVTFTVTEDTEIDIEHTGRDGSVSDLVPGARVAEVDVDDRSGDLEEVRLSAPDDSDD
jgi:hypothetical protein